MIVPACYRWRAVRWIGAGVRAVAIVVAMTALAAAARPKKIPFSVEIGPAGWRADALAAALRADLADDSLKLAPPGAPPEVTVRGELAGDELRYTIIRYGAPARGTIALTGLDRRALAGVLRDRLLKLVRPLDHVEAGAPADVPAPGPLGLVVLAVLAAALVAPLIYARRAVPATWRSLKMIR